MAYKSRYEQQLANALGKITNREKFQYDFNADPMYQAYKDQYTKLGNEAAQNAAANVSALTGGYGNSYATTAAAQANQQYLTKLNEQIPTLYQQALSKYQMEGDDLNNIYSILSDAENRDYAKYRDQVADEQWQKNYEMALNQFNESTRQWNENFNYQKQQDALKAAQAAAKAAVGSGGATKTSATGKTDKTDNKQTKSEWYGSEAGIPTNVPYGQTLTQTQTQAAAVKKQYNAADAPQVYSDYLVGLVNSGKITQKKANQLMEDFMAGRI